MIQIIKYFYKIPRVWKAVKKIEEAWDLIARERPEDADKMFYEGEKLLNKLNFELLLMKSFIKYKVNDIDACISSVEEFWLEIDKNKKLSHIDMMYLKSYAYGIFSIYEKFYDRRSEIINKIFIEDVDLASVSNVWKKRFPSRDHPDWDKYGV